MSLLGWSDGGGRADARRCRTHCVARWSRTHCVARWSRAFVWLAGVCRSCGYGGVANAGRNRGMKGC